MSQRTTTVRVELADGRSIEATTIPYGTPDGARSYFVPVPDGAPVAIVVLHSAGNLRGRTEDPLRDPASLQVD